jgi:hypothetical protein
MPRERRWCDEIDDRLAARWVTGTQASPGWRRVAAFTCSGGERRRRARGLAVVGSRRTPYDRVACTVVVAVRPVAGRR